MNPKTLYVFKALMKNGYITRNENPVVFDYFSEQEISDELEVMKAELDFDIYRAGSRIYLIPNQENELFSQDNLDFKKSVGSDARLFDIYLLNYIAIYLLYEFFHADGADPLIREFITVEDFIKDFTGHCDRVVKDNTEFENTGKRYGANFIKMADTWLAKAYGSIESNKFDEKRGCVAKVLRKLRDEDLFVIESEIKIRPTQKIKDLMPYYLNNERVGEINKIFAGGETDAADK